MASSSWIDTSGGSPRLKAGAAATGVLGTLLYGWYSGFIGFVDSAGDGVSGTLDGVATFITELFLSLPEGAEGVITAAATSNAEWLASLGLAGIAVGLVEGLAVFYLIAVTTRGVIVRVGRAL